MNNKRETTEIIETRDAPRISMSTNEDNHHNPFTARTLTQPNSDFAVFMHLLKASIGSGILFLPYAFSRAGYITALLSSLAIGSISCYTAYLLVQCSQILCRRLNKPSLNFGETAFMSFAYGPMFIRKYAGMFNVLTNVLVCFVQYQSSVVYALYVATSTQQIVQYHWNSSLDIRVYVVMFIPVYSCLAMIPNFKNLVPLSILGTASLGLGFIITIYYLFDDFPDPHRLDMFTDIVSVPIYCSIFLFAIHNISVILPLENSMKNKYKMKKIITFSMIINIFICMAFGFFGYNKYKNACDTMIKNLPLERPSAQVVKIAVTLSVICTYGLQYHVPVSILWPIIVKKIPRHHLACEIIFRVGGVLVTSLLSIAIPQLTPLLGLLTAITVTTLVLMIPIVIEIMTMWSHHDDKLAFYSRWARDIFIILVWLLLLIFGVLQNIREIIEAYKSHQRLPISNC